MKKITLCADDFALNESISEGILELIEHKKLSATSCMVTSALWPHYAKKLIPFMKCCDIGLHFNLTEGSALTRDDHKFFSLSSLITQCYSHQISIEFIENELKAQLDAFYNLMGKYPDFIDGHQHVQQLPKVRDVFIKVYQKYFDKKHKPYVRLSSNGLSPSLFSSPAALKKIVIYGLGSYRFQKLLKNNHIPYNATFSGVYDFSTFHNYPLYFKAFLQEIRHNGLIMCHPGKLNSETHHDSIAQARYKEYLFFLSEDFTALLKSQNTSIGQFTEVL